MSTRHREMLLRLLRQNPDLAAGLLDCVWPDLVSGSSMVRVESRDFSEIAPVCDQADAVVTFVDEDPVLAMVVEVQLETDERKHLTWPAYVATARARFGCPAVLLAVCTDDSVALRTSRPIEVGYPDFELAPLVLGPCELLSYTSCEDESVMPEMMVWAAAVNGAGPDGPKIFAAMLESLEEIESARARGYFDEVLAVLPEATRRILEAMVKTKDGVYKSDFARGYFSDGKAEGKAEGVVEMILVVLGARGIAVSEQVRARLGECDDLEQLRDWGRRAATAESVEDVFG